MTRLIALLLLLVVPLLAADRRTAMRNYRAGAAAAPGWQETDESGLVFFYDYSGTNAGAGNAVTVWPDLSGNGRPMTNSNSTVTYQTGGPNGKPYLQWAGNPTDHLMNTNATGFKMEPGTFFLAIQHTFTNEIKDVVSDYLGGFGCFNFQFNFDLPNFAVRSAAWDIGIGAVSGTAGPYGTNWLLLTSTYAAAGDFFVYTNHGVYTNGNNDRDLQAPTGWAIGGAVGDSKGNWRVARFLAYDHPLSGTARSNLVNKAKSDLGL